MKKKLVWVGVLMFMSLFFSQSAFSHCQIPCGIYGDEMRFQMIEEDIETVEKGMKQIVELSKEGDKNYNQIVRWVSNKDEHAGRIQEIVHQYFMSQRLAPVGKENIDAYRRYLEKLELLHQMLFYAMKAKQTTDLNYVEKLRSALRSFRKVYFAH
jgi:nickel superoxide dismutase